MAPNNSIFTEKLPLELRRVIYSHVLQREQAVKLPTTTKSNCARFTVALFRVSKSISVESREVFFEINTIRIRPHQLSDLINHHGRDLRQLHIEEENQETSLLGKKCLDAANTLATYVNLTPRLKTVTFDVKGLHMTVRELVQLLVTVGKPRNKLGFNIKDFQCTAVGIYTTQIPKLGQEWRFSYSLLADLWQSRSRCEDGVRLSSQDAQDYFDLLGPTRVPPWIFESGADRLAGMKEHNVKALQAQIDRYSAVAAVLPKVKLRTSQPDVLRRFELLTQWEIKEPVLSSCVEYSGRINLGDVDAAEDPGVLEWATELLAPNTKDFAAAFGRGVEDAERHVKRNIAW